MAGLRKRGRMVAGRSVRSTLGRLGAVAGRPRARRARRSRGMYMRKGRVFMGFTQKEVKNALRRSYGGRRKK